MEPTSRRAVLTALAGGAVLAPTLARADDDDDDISPTEDLMREHGVIRRALGVYEELARRIESAGPPPEVEVVAAAAELIHHFAEGYHEKLEEEQIFPRLEKAKKLVALCATLRAQHAAGRAVTEHILSVAKAPLWSNPATRAPIAPQLRNFVAMYQPHAAREDTEIFIAFRALVGPKKLDELGKQFEDQEHKLLGAQGFEKSLAEVQRLEKSLGLDDLARFTVKPG